MKVFHTYMESKNYLDVGIIVAESFEVATSIFDEVLNKENAKGNITEVNLSEEHYVITNRKFLNNNDGRCTFDE